MKKLVLITKKEIEVRMELSHKEGYLKVREFDKNAIRECLIEYYECEDKKEQELFKKTYGLDLISTYKKLRI